ncbi:PfaB family protein [Gloeobacter morelensis]|uniref:PfaB family protein n=1 Tax=Gloeobacter morelensis MG652769 TaxID=2781736 RepID=A0ABY3PMC2_9CYAN|nr:PfaB family protein [Gloeobacter morelensis]UFP94734.1 PfaB family protein [Gloeobacter morelensis MG652769]
MESIAIVGIACLFPGANDPAQFWRNLLDGRCEPGDCATGLSVDFAFDPSGYRLDPAFLEGLDRLFQWSLAVARGALCDSGNFNGEALLKRCGVVLGQSCLPTLCSSELFAPLYRETSALRLEQVSTASRPSMANALVAGYPAAVICRALGLEGGYLTVDAASASSVYAVELACAHLRARKADLMLAGAVHAAQPQLVRAAFAALKALPADGASRPLDRASQGLRPAQGAAMVALKRHSDALADGDRIYAVVRGTGLANDGQGRHLFNPSPRGQLLTFECAYEQAQVDPRSIGYIECHASGTPLGDRTELDSLERFFGRYHSAPLIGTVKSNVGHLLPAAGLAGLLKTVLSLHAGVIPPTVGVSDPIRSKDGLFGARALVRATVAHPGRLAALNAFGFGGANAHLILEQPEGHRCEAALAPAAPQPPEKLAIVGMDAHFGGACGLEAFGQTLYEGAQHWVPLPAERWRQLESEPGLLGWYGFEADASALRGAFLERFEVDLWHLRIPPHEADRLDAQQILMVQVAERALAQAGFARGGKVAVIVVAGANLSQGHQWLSAGRLHEQTHPTRVEPAADRLQPHGVLGLMGNLAASRIAALWDFTGPAFVLPAQGAAASFRALELAQMLIASGQAEAALVGAVDLAGGIENVLARHHCEPLNQGAATFGYDRDADGWMVGEGAAAVVLMPTAAAQLQKKPIWALLDAVGFGQTNASQPAAAAIEQAARGTLAAAGIAAEGIGFVEVAGGGSATHDPAEIAGLHAVYRRAESATVALGSATANIGHPQAAAGMASLVRTALCLHDRYLPAIPGWSGPKASHCWQESPFFVPSRAQPWLSAGQGRIAAISALDHDGGYAHAVLSEAPRRAEPPQAADPPFRPHLLVVAAADRADLQTQLEQLEARLGENQALEVLARRCHAAYRSRPDLPYALAIVGHDREEVTAQLRRAHKGIAAAFEQGKTWKTPVGSYFTAEPLGRQTRVAFVYPGAFNTYPGLGQDLLYRFPRCHRRLDELSEDAALLTREKLLYPRSLNALSARERIAHEERLLGDPVAMIDSGLAFAALYTSILQREFAVQPQAAFGYSLGETSMLSALGVWAGCDALCKPLRTSPLFTRCLAGPKLAAREHWAIAPEQATSDLWSSFVLLAPAGAVEQALTEHERVYLTHINTPGEVVIAGDSAQCQRLIERLGCGAVRAPFDGVLHCEAVRSRSEEIARLTTVAIQAKPDLAFYSTAGYAPIDLEAQSIAAALTANLCRRVDFPRLVERVYGDGHRCFIEVGPSGGCARWIAAILGDRPHLSLQIDQRGVSERVAIVRLLAALVSHRVPVDLTTLERGAAGGAAAPKTLSKTIVLGGGRLEPPEQRPGAAVQVPPPPPPWQTPLVQTATASRAHSSFLEQRAASLRQWGAMLQLQLAAAQQVLDAPVQATEHSSGSR